MSERSKKSNNNEGTRRDYEYLKGDSYRQEPTEWVFSLDELSLAEFGNERPLADVEEGLKRAVIGQDASIESLITALSREDYRNPKRPMGVFMFLGPTGVGKSETAKSLSMLLHGNEDAILKIDCSNFSEDHRVSALIGAAPEYVGREQKPIFDKKKIEQPRSIILFDEIEKGAPKLFDLLLNVLEDGEITLLNGGQKVSFRNSIIIFTSNIGAPDMKRELNPTHLGFHDKPKAGATRQRLEQVANNALQKSAFRPEFLNRIDEKIVFEALTDEQLGQILDLNVANANEYYGKQGIQLTLLPELRDELVRSTPERFEYGARPILRKYEKLVEGLMAKIAGSGGIPRGSHVYAVLVDGEDQQNALSDRIKLYYRQDETLAPNYSAKRKSTKVIERQAAINEDETQPIVLNKNQQMTLGAVAMTGIVALLFGDYINSRRRTKSRYA